MQNQLIRIKVSKNLKGLRNAFTVCIASLMLIVAAQIVSAQEVYRILLPDPIPSVYLGIASGINNYSGLIGIAIEAPISPPISLFGQAGIGTWGTKIGGGFRYYQNPDLYGSAWSIGYASASGLTDFEVEMEVENPKRNEMVLLDLEKVSTLNLDYSYNIRIGTKSKISLHLGYAYPLNKGDNYKLKTSGVQLSTTSKQSLKLIQPGGLLVGLALMLGI
ncbi:MAG: hypothetical protein IH597_15635 [Bacteroidales bacterium]|nr:hypothetical protein [Bacteroidales bacterium]